MSTADSAGCSTTGSGDSYLQFYLTFLNYDSTTINDLPYDAFVGMIQFHPVAGTPDTLEWATMQTASGGSGITALSWGSDWTGDT